MPAAAFISDEGTLFRRGEIAPSEASIASSRHSIIIVPSFWGLMSAFPSGEFVELLPPWLGHPIGGQRLCSSLC